MNVVKTEHDKITVEISTREARLIRDGLSELAPLEKDERHFIYILESGFSNLFEE